MLMAPYKWTAFTFTNASWQVMLDKVPAKSNFEAKPLSMCLDGDEMKRMVVNWSPSGEGSTRGMIRLVVNEAFRVQFVVLGCAIGSAKARKVGCFALWLFKIFGLKSWLEAVVKFVLWNHCELLMDMPL